MGEPRITIDYTEYLRMVDELNKIPKDIKSDHRIVHKDIYDNDVYELLIDKESLLNAIAPEIKGEEVHIRVK